MNYSMLWAYYLHLKDSISKTNKKKKCHIPQRKQLVFQPEWIPFENKFPQIHATKLWPNPNPLVSEALSLHVWNMRSFSCLPTKWQNCNPAKDEPAAVNGVMNECVDDEFISCGDRGNIATAAGRRTISRLKLFNVLQLFVFPPRFCSESASLSPCFHTNRARLHFKS